MSSPSNLPMGDVFIFPTNSDMKYPPLVSLTNRSLKLDPCAEFKRECECLDDCGKQKFSIGHTNVTNSPWSQHSVANCCVVPSDRLLCLQQNADIAGLCSICRNKVSIYVDG